MARPSRIIPNLAGLALLLPPTAENQIEDSKMKQVLLRLNMLRADRRAVTALEYGLIAAAVVAIGLAGFSIVGDDLQTKIVAVNDAMDPPS